jgi:hypothetical protein
VTGIDISGLIVDAGPVNSPMLVQIGSKNGNNGVPHNHASDPTALQDVFFRVGGHRRSGELRQPGRGQPGRQLPLTERTGDEAPRVKSRSTFA